MQHYDAIVIGSGQAGTPLSKKLAESGLKTALIEKRWIGGTCVNDGCSPTKAMIASAKAAWSVYHNKSLGIITDHFYVDFSAITQRKNDIVHRMRSNSEKSIQESKNLDLHYGTATFSGDKEITVTLNDGGSLTLSADKFFINTGEKPSIPKIEGIENIDYLTSTSIMELDSIPEHLLVLGSGYIGLEFGQMFKRFGSKVTILEPSERILKKEDQDIADEVVKILAEEDIEILTKTKALSVSKNGGKIIVTVDKDGKQSQLNCSHILIATGRKPQTKALSLEKTGVETDEKGYIKVNDRLETTAADIYALGDVKGGPAFTHISYDDYRIISENVIEKGNASIKDRLVPYCMFIDPQLGRVGITEQEARDQGLDILVATIKNDSVARSIETGDERGMMKAVIDAKTKQILGASVLAEQGGEIVTILQMAMMGNVTYDRIMNGVFAHPTYAESLNNLFMSLEQ
ncbi:mercuric reductase [Dyadobacter psychrophilus]|uniref:Pyruvate/2-oxoglutarate dehydrogenase complex, dihydrolipoamide dehydrogenase (E3) component n=1 Tax=Dyadobacter psychrophilus TaxID=651661 RepID=A0A1T5ENQ9_9BACT|nr:mercuric reductase [Dyadobacter psychrophilus]SKB85577.1 Pyruvate/2-oxoglutarate dehydrogenase complex, dihydrolipoamide dehydrogenase (E3) component [Dyadobacter psychrophilus]